MPDIEARLSRLETESRRWRAAALSAFGVATVAIFAGQNDPATKFGTIQAERLEIVDTDGNLVAAAEADANGGRFDLWTKDGGNIVRFAGNEHGGDVNIWNRSGRSVYAAWATAGGAEASIWSSDGARAVRFGSTENGGMIDLHGRPVGAGSPAPRLAGLRATELGGHLEINNRAGATVTSIDVAADAGGRFTLRNAASTTIASLETDRDEGGHFILNAGTGDRRLTLTSSRVGGGVTVQSPQGIAFGAGTAPNGAGYVDLHGASSEPLVTLGGSSDGGRLQLSDSTGRPMLTAEALASGGAALLLSTPSAARGLAFAARSEGGLFNLFNQHDVAVMVAGTTPGARGGTLSIANGRGLPVIHTGSNADDAGELKLYDENGEKGRTVKPLP